MTSRLLLPLVVLAIATVCVAAGGDAVASGVSQNSVSGDVGGPTGKTTFTATSGPNGEAPTGHVSGHRGGGLGSNFEGSVTCLMVHGYAAVIGGTGTWTNPYSGGLSPSPSSESFLIVTVDNSPPKTGQFGEVLPGSPPDQFGENETTNDCSMASSVQISPQGEGDVFVRDARDKPPRLSVPRVRITVRKRQRVAVRFRVSATDDFDRHPVVRCSPRSGSRFPIGATLVRCTARDRSGLTRSAAFRVHVKFRAR